MTCKQSFDVTGVQLDANGRPTCYRCLDAAPIDVRANGSSDVQAGALWLFGGILVTVISYSLASGEGGGRYMLMYGPMIYGVFRIIKGLGA